MCRFKIINVVLASSLLASAAVISQAAPDVVDLPTIAEGLKSPDHQHRAKHVEELKKTIRSRLSNHDEVRLVAQFLQDNPVPEVLPDLIERIDYSQHIGSIKSPSYEYPYSVALACLGSPAGSAIIDSISSDEKEFRRYLLRDALLQAVGFEESIRLLNLRLADSTGVARERLQEQLAKIEKSRDRLSTKGIPERIKAAQAKAAIDWAKLRVDTNAQQNVNSPQEAGPDGTRKVGQTAIQTSTLEKGSPPITADEITNLPFPTRHWMLFGAALLAVTTLVFVYLKRSK